ncbi:MAG TPA: SLBB domain-containing protein [Candidatus Acidoferrales bacterium]|jgi:protein involved in polysaccharide export with SLBB domain|nr:SLBB domain-containing protein [Candidatus Acidoferrales bacterium]
MNLARLYSLAGAKRLAIFSFLAALGWCTAAIAQTAPAAPSRQTSTGTRQNQAEIEQEKSRVAAPAEQIRVILVKDPGLLVELERLVEREAIANGQLVEDSDLTQDAIFERLDNDIAFRAAATRLLQHYGYLLPTLNPNSEIGKEQDLVLKERARRLVQIEAQEDAESLKPPKAEDGSSVLAGDGNCDSGSDNANCKQPAQHRTRRDFANPGEPPQETVPAAPPGSNPIPKMNGSPVIQTRLSGGGSLDGSDSNDLIRLAAMDASRDPSGLSASSEDLQRLMSRMRNGSANSDADTAQADSSAGRTYAKNESAALPLMRGGRTVSSHAMADSSQGTIVRKASPYSDVPSLVDLYVQVSAHDKAPERFGINILTAGGRDSGAVPMDLPVGPDYVVGPGDGLAIDLWGGVSQRLQRTVDREGRISLPEYGPILVSGKTLGEVQLTVQQLLRTQLRDISTDVSLSRLRTVRVYVVGEVAEPGAYDISSLSSPLNALVAAGGLTEHGSLRLIKHYRGKQLVEVVDAYDLLLRGAGLDEVKLENGDSLMVPPVGPQIMIEGMVRRPAIYELRGNTSLEEALDLAGGVLPAAALKHVEVERLVAHENRTMLSLDLSEKPDSDEGAAQLRSFHVQDGDRIHIFPIAPYNDQAIYLQGHVLRPGRYSFREGMTVRDLITSYSDLLPEPAGSYAEIIRLNPPDNRPSVESFDLSAALSNGGNAPILKPLDTVRIFSKYDFEPAPDIRIDGEVRIPGQYITSGQAHFRDAIFLAGGVTADAAMDSAQVYRSGKDGTLTILSVNLGDALAGKSADNLVLQPHDRIVVHRNATKAEPPAVYVKGDIVNPGRYPLTANMRVEDLVHAAGGLKPSADSQSAVLTHREEKQNGETEVESLNVNLSTVMTGHGNENKPLVNGDVLTIREKPDWTDMGATVTLRGEVEHPGTYGIGPGETLSAVLEQAGGFTSQAYPYGIVLTRREVREIEMKSQEELVARVKAEETQLKALPENDADQKNLKLTAIAQTDTALTQLETYLPVGRVVIPGALDEKSFDRTSGETPLRNGDVILVPKKPNYVVVQGQVFNGTAVGYVQGRSANWYLSQAGGFTELADKKAVFVIRADGSVLAAKNNHPMWAGDPMDAVLMPGDVIVVPEKAPKIGNRNWVPLMQTAQVATSVALAVAYLRP